MATERAEHPADPVLALQTRSGEPERWPACGLKPRLSGGHMNWEAIGAIGEIIGAAAVVVTLAYFALQIRHAQQAAADTSRLNRGVGIRELLATMASDDEMRDAWVGAEGTADRYARIADALDVPVTLAGRIEHMCQCWWWLHWAHWASSKTDQDVEGLRHVIAAFYSRSPMSVVWELSPNVAILEPEFVRFVESALESVKPEGIPQTP
jgi:hypothetical protein